MSLNRQKIKNFDIAKIDSHGPKLSDGDIFSIILANPRYAVELEKYVKDYEFFYYIILHFCEMTGERGLGIITQDCPMTDKLQKFIIKILKCADMESQTVDSKLILPNHDESNRLYYYENSFKMEFYYHNYTFVPYKLMVYTIISQLVNNIHTGYSLLETILRLKIPNSLYAEHIRSCIGRHPNFSAAKAIMKHLESV